MTTNSMEDMKAFMISAMDPARLAGLLGAGSETSREDRVSWWLWPALGLLALGLLYSLWERGDALIPPWLV
jgi:hypothetical protein